MKRVGILGGTFDPIHLGHIRLGKEAIQQFALDMLWVMPSPNPPHKTNKQILPYDRRIEMIKLAISNLEKFTISELEVYREGKSYTSETLEELKKRYPNIYFYFIMGADSLYEIETWNRPEVIMKLSEILVADRKYEKSNERLETQIQYLRQKYQARIERIYYEKLDISSEQIRKKVQVGEDIGTYVDYRVKDYIQKYNLYQDKKEK